jgi:tetratricopeptide (TPR) repeat protein
MKKVMVGLMVGLMAGLMGVAAMAASDKTNAVDLALSAAADLMVAKDPGAKSAMEKVLKDYPDAPVNTRAKAQWFLGRILCEEGDYAGAKVALGKVATDYPSASTTIFAEARVIVANIARAQGDSAEALAVYQSVGTNYPTAGSYILALAQLRVGGCYQELGKPAEANAAFIACINNYAYPLGAASENATIWVAFKNLNPKLMTVAEYRTLLTDTIKAVTSNESNAKFLGYLQDQLDKLPK